MKIESLKISGIDGYIECQSNFYQAHNVCNSQSYDFVKGVNMLEGEIDSGVWAVSYLLSMAEYKKKDFILFEPVQILINNQQTALGEALKYSMYMDKSYPLFSIKKTVSEMVSKALKTSNRQETPDEIRDLFHIDQGRFIRPLSGAGNERFRAMAAIGFCYGKEIFCFPWLSKMRFDYYHGQMEDLFNILTSLNKMVILPLGK